MKTLKFALISMLFIALISGISFAQKQNYPSKPKDGQTELIDYRIDNMNYWRKMADKGLVPVAPEKKNEEAVYTGSKINAKSVKTEDSPDVPVTDATNVTQSENSIFVDPTDNEILLNSNNSTGWSGGWAGSLYGSNSYLSDDAGETWGGSSAGAGGSNSGDPTTAINLDGTRMYVGFIHANGGQGVSHSTDGGSTWTSVQCGTPPGGWNILDKNHLWIDNSPTSAYEGNLYNAWTGFGNSNDSDIEFVKSTDGGLTWTSHMNISSDVNALSHNQGVNIQTGPNGEVYACWAIYDAFPADETAIGFTKSTDGGGTFGTAERIITDIRGIRNTETSKSMRVNSFPSMTVDISGGDNDGNIYIVWANVGVPGDNIGPEIDVYMIRSEDEGDTWSDPVRVNQDPMDMGKEHYFPWITCDPETGTLSAIFYDDRNVTSSQCEVFCANSFDAGETWEDFKVSDVSFTPTPISGLAGDYMGDYLGIIARGSMVYPVWTDTRDNLFMTYTSPYVTNSLPRPTDLEIELDEETGTVGLSWLFDEEETYLYFNVYRNNELLGTTTELSYSDNLPDYGVHIYKVSAMHEDGESVPASKSVQWGNAHIDVTPTEISVNLESGQDTVKEIIIENVGELELVYTVNQEITSKGGSKDYCDASGGCDEYISKVILGDIENSSGCDSYADYTSMSTILNISESYDITVENGYVYSSDDLGVWIDWNQDGDFDDTDENVVCEIDNGGEGTYSFVVPVGALPGETRMRVRIKYSGSDCGDPCGTTSYGEVEDYSVYVLGWLMVSPLLDTVQPGQVSTVQVALNSTDLEDGLYTANIHFSNNDPDNLMVTVPVSMAVGENIPSVEAWVEEGDICEGESTQLFSEVTGGSGSVTYEWSSIPEGFTSTEQNPLVNPDDTTIYIVKVVDGIFTVSDSTDVNILPLPTLASAPTGETEFCQDAENTTYETEGADYAFSYLWELSPEAAGTISGEGKVGIVNWNMDFSGEATIIVKGVNDCGVGEDSEQLIVMVHPLPEVVFELGIDSVCVYTPEFELTTAEPSGGEYSGNGVSEMTGSYYFDPETAGTGEHTILYTYVNEYGCENSVEDLIYVGECLGINEVIDGLQVEIFPNPSSGHFSVKLTTKYDQDLNVKIFNSLGNVVYFEDEIRFRDIYTTEIDLSEFSEGIYFVNLLSDEINYVKKIVIRK